MYKDEKSFIPKKSFTHLYVNYVMLPWNSLVNRRCRIFPLIAYLNDSEIVHMSLACYLACVAGARRGKGRGIRARDEQKASAEQK